MVEIMVAKSYLQAHRKNGDNGGQVVFTGTPEELVKEKKSLLSKFLKPKLSSK